MTAQHHESAARTQPYLNPRATLDDYDAASPTKGAETGTPFRSRRPISPAELVRFEHVRLPAGEKVGARAVRSGLGIRAFAADSGAARESMIRTVSFATSFGDERRDIRADVTVSCRVEFCPCRCVNFARSWNADRGQSSCEMIRSTSAQVDRRLQSGAERTLPGYIDPDR